MQVITTHFSADFDCLAAMVAARKLYPEASMVFSGSVETAPQDFLRAFNDPFPFARIKDIDLGQVTRLIVVDTQDPERIGPFKALLGKKGVEVHVFDHHLDITNPLPADYAVIRKRGASATILLEELEAHGITLSALEANLMVLGIYQDTHSLISPSTTPEDFYAAGRLIGMGADLNVVSDFAETRLNREQLDVMNDLIVNLEVQNFNGVDIGLATATLDMYAGDLSVVVQKVMELENLNVLFAMVRLDCRVYLIGRSRTKEVNVAQILREFGGGGHPNAAAASTRDMTLIQAREKLVQVLQDKVEPLKLVKNVMHYPVITVNASESIEEAERKMTRFNINTLPVMSGRRPVGLLTRQIVEKAIHHRFGREPAGELMEREFSVTTPDAYFKTIVPVIIEEKQKLVPVVHPEDGRLIGIVTRGDLLRLMHQDFSQYASGPYASLLERSPYTAKHVKSLMSERLPKNIMDLLTHVAKTAEKMEMPAYVVGGFVRDLLLNIENLDIDIVVEGDGIRFAKALARDWKGRVVCHEKFGTSVIILPDGFKLDVASARTEYYKHPAALPTVEMSSIKSDLFRRDFTFNSMAIRLNGKDAFTLIDYFNGQRDLKDKVVRVLHNLSFIEDPCRAFRAVRFEQRLQFTIGKQTEAFIKQAVKKRLFDKLSGSRMMNELILILKEKKPSTCIRRMRELGLLQFIHPRLGRTNGYLAILEQIEEIFALSKIIHLVENPEIWWIYFLGLAYHLEPRERTTMAKRLHLSQKQCRRLKEDIDNCRAAIRALKRKAEPRPSEVYSLLSAMSPEAVLLLLAVSDNERVNKQVLLYFTQYHDAAELALNGDDLRELGMKPGPVFKTVFQTLREARLNGQVRSRQDEVNLVERQFLKAR